MATKRLCSSAATATPIFAATLLITFALSLTSSTHRALALDIVIGGGGGSGQQPECGCAPPLPSPPPPPPVPCPPPPSPPPPPPSPPPPQPPQQPEPRLTEALHAIQAFKSRITRDPLGVTKTWVGNDPCKYKGFRCVRLKKHNNQRGVYAALFNGFQFGGDHLTLDGFIDKLPDLTLFHANTNSFSGRLPDSIADLPYLYELDLSNNDYEGEVPEVVLRLNQLTYLDLRFNRFTGRVPPQLFALQPGPVALFVNDNHFQGGIPDDLGSTTAAFLTLANDGLSGPIPRSIGRAAGTLLEVLLLGNSLSGCLPYEIGLLNNTRVFDAGQNQLTGPIPISFGCLGSMQYLILARNRLYGPIPEAVCKLPKLVNLTLSENYFTQAGPECMKLIHKKVLDVRGNCILGQPNQRPAQECEWFFKKPTYCAEAHMMKTYVPCKLGYDGSRVDRVQHKTMTYAALSPSSN